jgi:hypothetical protein
MQRGGQLHRYLDRLVVDDRPELQLSHVSLCRVQARGRA